MRKKYLLVFAVLFLADFIYAGDKPSDYQQRARHLMGSQPVHFLENKGQMTDADGKPVPFVLFKAKAPGMNLYVTETGFSYVFVKIKEEHKDREFGQQEIGRKEEERIVEWSRIDMNLKGASIKKDNILKDIPSITNFDYYLGHCPDGIRNVKQFDKITIKNVYPKIDWVLYNSAKNGFKYDFVVHPGGDPGLITMSYKSRDALHLDKEGRINIKTTHGTLTENAPYSYILETGRKVESDYQIVSVSRMNGDHHTNVSFQLSDLKTQKQTLIIDPQLVWGTLYGGNDFDGPMSTVCDQAGNLFVTGYMSSTDFPGLDPAGGAWYQGALPGFENVFILKFDNSGVLLWATYYGGTVFDGANFMTADTDGNIFITGYTYSDDFPVSPGAFQPTYSGKNDAFVMKFSNSGVREWATYYGSIVDDIAYGVTVDDMGNVFITGHTYVSDILIINDLPVQDPGGGAYYQNAYGGGSAGDAFIAKFSGTGNLVWSTFYGGNEWDGGRSIAYDRNGSIYVTGFTASLDFPTQPMLGAYFQGAYGNPVGGGWNKDMIILKFDTTGVLKWSTYYGGSEWDEGYSIAADAQGNVFITGVVGDAAVLPVFPLLDPGGGAYFQGLHGGILDAFILKFDAAGVLVWSTFYGGSIREGAYETTYDNLEIDSCGNVYVAFHTTSPDNYTLDPGCNSWFQGTKSGIVAQGFDYLDVFLTKFTNDGVLLWATYMGSEEIDFRTALATDKNGNLYMSGEFSGYSSMVGLPMIDQGGGAYFDTITDGTDDAYILKFVPDTLEISQSQDNSGCICNGSAQVNISCGTAPYSYSWSNGNQLLTTDTFSSITNLCPDAYSVTVTSIGDCGLPQTLVYDLPQPPPVSANTVLINDSCNAQCEGGATASASGGTSPFTYLWSGGETDSTITGLCVGDYTVTITDSNGCTDSEVITISEPLPLTSSLTASHLLCFNDSSGMATANAAGGTTGYSFLWDADAGNQITPTASSLSAGTYSVIITDANSCTVLDSITITEPSDMILTPDFEDASCGQSDGEATVTPSGGTGPGYTFLWDNNAGGQITPTATGLPVGDYAVIVTDQNGCKDTLEVIIGNINGPSLDITDSIGVTCFGDCDGQATAVGLGGTGVLNYLWDPSTGGQATALATGLCGGNFSVTVTDSNGCKETTTVIITEPLNLSLAVTSGNATCDENNGEAEAIAQGGTGPYNFLWNDSLNQNTYLATGLPPGSYTVIVTDGRGCQTQQTVTVNMISTTPLVNAWPDTMILAGSSVSVSSSGGDTCLWMPSTGLNDQNSCNTIATPDQTTTYIVTVTENGCKSSDTITIIVEPLQFTIYVPNSFTPNGDNINETFQIKGIGIDEFQLRIYSRWGELIFESNDINTSWDGTLRQAQGDSRDVQQDVYVYELNVVNSDNDLWQYVGRVSVIK